MQVNSRRLDFMDSLSAMAASGMRSRMESLDLLANNMANASTAGFKADRDFYSLYISADAENASSDPSTQPVIEKNWIDFSQGSLTSTSSPLDVAIGGKGFFSVDSSRGTLYTRDGSFRISPQGDLVTQDGYKVLTQDGKAITVDASKTLEISPEGMVRQDGADIAAIGVVDFADVQSLSKRGQNYFQLSSDLKPIAATKVEILQGKLESANFQPAEAAARLITVMRQFESLQRAMSIGLDMNKKSIDEVARAG